MQTFYPPLKKRPDIDEAADQSPTNGQEGSNVQEGLPRRGHSGLVIQAAAKAAASGTAASYCAPGLWLGHRQPQTQAPTQQKAPTRPTGYRASRSSSHPVGDSLDVTFQERLTSFGADQLSELVELIEAKHSQFSPVSLCTAIHRVAAFQQGSKQYQRCQGLLSTLESQLRERPSRFRAQSIANACWAVAKLHWNAQSLMETMILIAEQRVDHFKPQELSLFLWGIASSRTAPKDAEATAAAAIASEFLQRGSAKFDAQSTATLAYSAGVLLVTNEAFWSAMDAGSADRVSEFSDRQLANLVWGFATVAYTDCTAVFTRVAKEAPIAKLAPIDLSLVAWSMAKVAQGGQEFYDEVADAVCCKRDAWKISDTRNIATLLYSLALAEQAAAAHEGAFRILAEAACKRPGEFSLQGLTNAVWAFATACYTDERWFAVVASEVLKRDHSEFELLDVANCLWAYAAVLHKDPHIISRLTSLGKVMMTEFSAQNLAISAWALASLEVRDHHFFERAADPFVARLAECKSQELNNMLWAYATVGVRLPWLFIKVANHAKAVGLAEFKMHELSIMMWAHGTAGVCNHDFFDDARGLAAGAPRAQDPALNTRCFWFLVWGRAADASCNPFSRSLGRNQNLLVHRSREP